MWFQALSFVIAAALLIVAHPRVWIVDCLLLLAGGGFAALGWLVYAP